MTYFSNEKVGVSKEREKKKNPVKVNTNLSKAILAGLVSISAGCGDMTLGGSFLTGLVGGISMLLSSQPLKSIDQNSFLSIFGVYLMW